MEKKLAQRVHAKRRAEQRYGISMNRDSLRQLIVQIQAGKARVLERQSLRVSVLELCIDGNPIPLVYDHKRKTIVTFLPKSPNRHVGEI